MTVPVGNFVGLNLGPIHSGPGSHVGLNLGVDWSTDPPDPPDPPEPVIRGLRRQIKSPWGQHPVVRRQHVSPAWQPAASHRRGAAATWGRGILSRKAATLAWQLPPALIGQARLVWGGQLSLQRHDLRIPWQTLPLSRGTASAAWKGQLQLARQRVELPWRHPGLTAAATRMPWMARMPRAHRDLLAKWQHPGLWRGTWKLPWGNAPRVPWRVLPPKPTPPAPQPDSPFPPGNLVGLNLGCPVIGVPGLAPLNLGVAACYAVRPQRRTYIVSNSVQVVRLPDRTPIEVDTVSVSGAADSWAWSFDLGLSRPADLALLVPTVSGPRQIEVTLNGEVWTAVVESYGSRREFGASGVSISGRSRTALLAPPYAPLRTKVSDEERSVAQLVDEELASTGYTANYDTVDWLVPAAAWFYDGTAPLDAVSRLAAASGGVVQSDPEDLVLHIRPRYPVSPWEWPDTTPDVVVQDDIMLSASLQVRSMPLYDAVVVTGEIQGKGVTARVKRSGEAGTLYAPQVSSPLINTDAVAHEAGRNVLSDRGEQAAIEVTLPLFAQPVPAGGTGRVLPLDLVEVRESTGTWHGLCTGVRIDARTDGKAWVIEQTLTLERHFTDAN